VTLHENALRIATEQAALDRALLARLVRGGRVMRSGPASELTRENRSPSKRIDWTIIPKRKRRKR
jgi:hypothetical protein